MKTLLAPSALIVAILTGAGALANDPNACDVEGEVPDIIVGDLQSVQRWASDGVHTAFSVGTTSCNQGTCEVAWIRTTPDHPVIGQNMYRLKDGRLEQIGMSWLKHGFFATSQSLCFEDCVGTNGTVLGVHCSDPYSAGFNGDQTTLGPRSEVNPATGVFPYPFTTQGQTGGALYKRLQVANNDLDPGANPGALYFVEGQYINEDDATANTDENNVSYRQVEIVNTNGAFSAALVGETVRTLPAIHAWATHQPGTTVTLADIPDDGRVTVAAAVTEIEPGRFRYEYAVHNLNSDRAGRAFSVPLPVGASVEGAGFHDVDYHSGEPYDGKDWDIEVASDASGNRIRWWTDDYQTNPAANALRWGTLYNFWFESDAPPTSGPVELVLFRPGTPAKVEWVTQAPLTCDADGVCEPGEDCVNCAVDCLGETESCCGDGACAASESPCDCPGDCGAPFATEIVCDDGLDLDCDGSFDCDDSDCCGQETCGTVDADGDGIAGCDCNDADASAWAVPGEVRDLRADRRRGALVMVFTPPLDPGADTVLFDVLRSSSPTAFDVGAACVVWDAAIQQFSDADDPLPAEVFHYLVRAVNGCATGGALGTATDGTVRLGRDCP